MYRSNSTLLVRKKLWVYYTIVALMFIQGVQLHVHVYSHDSALSGHVPQEQSHFNYDVSVSGHPDELAKIDFSQQGLLKNLSFGSLIIALFVAVSIFFLPRLLTRVARPRDRHGPLILRPFTLRPPLRAPPL